MLPTFTDTSDEVHELTAPWVVEHEPPMTAVLTSGVSCTITLLAVPPPLLLTMIVYKSVAPGAIAPEGNTELVVCEFCKNGPATVAVGEAVAECVEGPETVNVRVAVLVAHDVQLRDSVAGHVMVGLGTMPQQIVRSTQST